MVSWPFIKIHELIYPEEINIIIIRMHPCKLGVLYDSILGMGIKYGIRNPNRTEKIRNVKIPNGSCKVVQKIYEPKFY